MNNSFVLLILSLVCFWLILDEVYGNKYISSFATVLLPNSSATSNIQTNVDTDGDGKTDSAKDFQGKIKEGLF